MTTVKTIRFYLACFGSIQNKMEMIGGDSANPTRNDIFEYEFKDDTEFFNHFRKLNVKTIGGLLEKGNTQIGRYDRAGAENRDRPLRRLNSQKFRDKQNGT